MRKQQYIKQVDRLCKEYGIADTDTAGMNGPNIRQYVINAYDLIGERVAIHTNRNAHIWSIKSTDSKHKLLAYALDCVFLKDVCWLPPTISAARYTYRKLKIEDKQARTVQAFAEGVLVAVDDMPMIEFDSNETIQVRYNPMREEWLGAFRDTTDRKPIASSEFGSLTYTDSLGEWHRSGKPAGRRPTQSFAYNDVQWIPTGYDENYVQNILEEDNALVKRMKPYISPSCKSYRRR